MNRLSCRLVAIIALVSAAVALTIPLVAFAQDGLDLRAVDGDNLLLAGEAQGLLGSDSGAEATEVQRASVELAIGASDVFSYEYPDEWGCTYSISDGLAVDCEQWFSYPTATTSEICFEVYGLGVSSGTITISDAGGDPVMVYDVEVRAQHWELAAPAGEYFAGSLIGPADTLLVDAPEGVRVELRGSEQRERSSYHSGACSSEYEVSYRAIADEPGDYDVVFCTPGGEPYAYITFHVTEPTGGGGQGSGEVPHEVQRASVELAIGSSDVFSYEYPDEWGCTYSISDELAVDCEQWFSYPTATTSEICFEVYGLGVSSGTITISDAGGDPVMVYDVEVRAQHWELAAPAGEYFAGSLIGPADALLVDAPEGVRVELRGSEQRERSSYHSGACSSEYEVSYRAIADEPGDYDVVFCTPGGEPYAYITFHVTEPTFQVVYEDGCNGTAFSNQVFEVEKYSETPKFDGSPVRDGYVFDGWSPEVAEIVTENATYTANWVVDTRIATGTWGTCPWEISADGVLIVHPGIGESYTFHYGSPSTWSDYGSVIKSIEFIEENGQKVTCPENSSLEYLFYGLNNVTSINLEGLDTSGVTNMNFMFANCSSLTELNLSPLDTSGVTNMNSMFAYCSSLTELNLSPLDTSSVTDMSGMFYFCSSLQIVHLDHFDTSCASNMDHLFWECSSLKSLDLSNFVITPSTQSRNMIYGCTSLKTLTLGQTIKFRDLDSLGLYEEGWSWAKGSPDSEVRYSSGELAVQYDGATMADTYYWTETPVPAAPVPCAVFDSSDGSLVFYDSLPDELSETQLCYELDSTSFERTWTDISDEVISVRFADVIAPTSTSFWFKGMSSCVSIDLSNLDTSNVVNMVEMFSDCSCLTSLDLSGFDMSNVEYLNGMFSGCSLLSQIKLGESFLLSDVSGLHVSKEGWSWAKGSPESTERYTSEELVSLFDGATMADTYYWTSNGSYGSCEAVFDSSDGSLRLYAWDNAPELTETQVLFKKTREYDYGWVPPWNDVSSSVLSVEVVDVIAPWSTREWFAGMSSCTLMNLTNLDTTSVSTMASTFYGCSSLTSLDISGFITSNTIDMRSMFSGCSSLLELDLSSLDTSSVSSMTNMFYDCSSLTSLDISGFITSNTIDMSSMFSGCSSLLELDLSRFTISGTTEVEGMFYGCRSLRELKLGVGVKALGNLPNYNVYDIPDWLSEQTGTRFTSEQIISSRLGIADTYTKSESPNPANVNCWWEENGFKYYLGPDGVPVVGWKKIDGEWYYLEPPDGVMATEKWKKDSRGWVYLGKNGAMVTEKWVMDSVGWCYVGKDGYAVKSQWKRDSKGWCYLDEKCRLAIGWKKISGKWYWFDDKGRMAEDKWVKDSKGWVYLGKDGAMATDKWVMDSVGWCYVGSDGYAVRSQWKDDSVGRCYLDEKCRLAIGWKDIDGKTYWFDSKGRMATGTRVIDGVTYTFGSDGALVG